MKACHPFLSFAVKYTLNVCIYIPFKNNKTDAAAAAAAAAAVLHVCVCDTLSTLPPKSQNLFIFSLLTNIIMLPLSHSSSQLQQKTTSTPTLNR